MAELAQPPEDWVTVRIEACGICGTDVEEYTTGPVLIPTQDHPLSGRKAPLTLGHEAVGVIDGRGNRARIDEGTRVAIEGNMFCGQCYWCKRHQYSLCSTLACLGLMGDGGLAERMLAPAYMCLPLTSATPSPEAVLAEPLSVAVRAVRRAGIRLGSTVGVVGCGTVGNLVVQAARLAGAATILAIDSLDSRRELAIRVGATAAVAPAHAQEAALQLTRGIGIDFTIEAAGNPPAAAAAVRLARKGGRTVLLGVFSGDVPVDMMDLLLGEKEIVASLSHVWDEDFSVAVDLINARQVILEPLVTDRIRLVEIVTHGFEQLLAE
ncbi:MAG: zinc-binding dehydrogenase, partial [Candidatus Dormibacteria bacterium]